jgi:hypothetical protein
MTDESLPPDHNYKNDNDNESHNENELIQELEESCKEDEEAIRRLIASLDIAQFFPEPPSKDLEYLIHTLDSASIILFGKVLEYFLRAYHKAFPGPKPILPEAFDEYAELVFEEQAYRLLRFVLKQTLLGNKLGLTELTEHVYSATSKSLGRYRQNLRDDTVWPMKHIGLWTVVLLNGKTRNGGDRTAGYEIWASRALYIFHRDIFVPWRVRQIRDLNDRLGDED